MMFENDVVIGLEVHAELKTDTKLFCACSTKNAKQNTLTCPTCLGLPGSKPVINKKAIEYGLRLALALNCDIAPELVFSRKVYFYPDLVKNYQITQFEHPLGNGGALELIDGTKIELKRMHLEEDPGSLSYPSGSMKTSPYVLIDYNRSGHPLCEIVTQPVIKTPKQAREFMKTLLTTLHYLGIFEQGTCILKADANVSIKESGYTRVEIKNIGGFKDIEEALIYEIARQQKVVAEGGEIIVETRGYDSNSKQTFSMRKKESEADYGYITEPDLVQTPILEDTIESIKKTLPMTPRNRALSMIEQGVPQEDAYVLSNDFELAQLHEELSGESDAIFAAKLVRRDIPRVLKYHDLNTNVIDASIIKEMLTLLSNKTITQRTLQKLLEEYSNALAKAQDENGNIINDNTEPIFNPAAFVKAHGLEVLEDDGALETACKKIIEANPEAVADYQSGNAGAFNFFVGQVMRETKGKADPDALRKLLQQLLSK
jgi:aspartyl-tRNA(Asn)/glutamyl-tRNA(Gln) amidotransferase subunit B